jgi:hypothetical protein
MLASLWSAPGWGTSFNYCFGIPLSASCRLERYFECCTAQGLFFGSAFRILIKIRVILAGQPDGFLCPVGRILPITDYLLANGNGEPPRCYTAYDLTEGSGQCIRRPYCQWQ